MAKTIYEYTLEVTDEQTLMIPKSGEFLDFQMQFEMITFWMEVDLEDFQLSEETFYVVGTGNPIPEKAQHYHGTVQIQGFVWHIYQRII